MDFSKFWQFLPYAARMSKAMQTLQRLEADPAVQDAVKAVQTIERLEKDPDVQDGIQLFKELSALLAKVAAPEQHG